MTQKFSYEERDRLRDDWRREHLDPDAFWRRVGLRRGQTVVDVGAGIGYFALPAARRVGPSGRVYACDVSSDMVRHMAREADKAGLGHLEVCRNDEGHLPLRSHSADLVLAAFVLHEVDEPVALLADIGRVLKPDGRLIVLDWAHDAHEPENLPRRQRYAPATVKYLIRRAGLKPAQPVELNCANYMVEAHLAACLTG